MTSPPPRQHPQWEDVELPSTCTTPHKSIKLSNGLKLTVVHDVNCLSAAAAMSIAVGSLQDPAELPGLAHLCEHMLFLGTEKYPMEGEYNRFLSQHGGSGNASTEDMTTNFHFTLHSNDGFMEALDRFIHFFVSPLFTATSLEREISAVHSEDENNHSSDFWRQHELWKLMLDPDHPASRYGNGNRKTLWTIPQEQGVDVRANLLDFYDKYYVAEGASLCVYSSLDPNVIFDAVAPVLEKMKTGNSTRGGGRPTQQFGGLNPLSSSSYRKWFNIKTVKAMRKLRLSFVIPYSVSHYQANPSSYVSHIIGHECEGSISAVLKDKGYIESLIAGTEGRGIDNDFDVFFIEVSLTADGLQKMQSIITIIFHGIELLRRSGVVDEIYEEDRLSKRLAFNLTFMGQPHDHAELIARGANIYTPQRAWSSAFVSYERNDDLMNDVVNYLIPEKCVFLFQTHEFEFKECRLGEMTYCTTPLDATTKHHNAPYSVVEVDAKHIESWTFRANPVPSADPTIALTPELHMPHPNPFVPDDLTVHPQDTDREPKKVKGSYGSMLWRRDIGNHPVPKCLFCVEFLTPIAYASPLHRYFNDLFVSCIQDFLNESLYFAELGFIITSIIPTLNGIEIKAGGPSQKMPVLFKIMCAAVLEYHPTREKFNIVKVKVARDIESAKTEQPFALGNDLSNTWLHRELWNVVEVAEATTSPFVTFDDFTAYLSKYRQCLRYEACWYGNIAPPSSYTAPPTTPGSISHRVALDVEMQLEVPLVVSQCLNILEELLLANKVVVALKSELPDVHSVLKLPDARQTLCDTSSTGSPQSDLDSKKRQAVGWLLSSHNFNPEDPNCSVEVQFQMGIKYPAQKVLGDVIKDVLESLFFDTLRTQETLGYIVACAHREIDETSSLAFIVQSASFDVTYIYSRIIAFLRAAPTYLKNSLSDEEFKSIIDAAITTRKDKPKTCGEEGSRLWSRRTCPFGFFYEDLEIDALEKLTKEQVIEGFEQYVTNGTRYVIAMHPTSNELPSALTPEGAGDVPTDDERIIEAADVVAILFPPKATATTREEEIALDDFTPKTSPSEVTPDVAEVPPPSPGLAGTTEYLRLVPSTGPSSMKRSAFRAALRAFPIPEGAAM